MSKVNKPKFWEQAYQAGRTRWDLGTPTPVFQRLAETGQFSPGRMMVLGAGRGYDARLFAQRGFTVTAVDFAAEAVRDMQAMNDPQTPVDIIQGDIFELPPALNQTFDYLLEYTCFCAIAPNRRADYADLATRLLKPGGTFIMLLFPIWDHPEGPPFAVTSEEVLALFPERGFTLRQQENQPPDSVSPRRPYETLLIFEFGGNGASV